MSEQNGFLSAEERQALEQIVEQGSGSGDAQRAQALLAIADGQTRADAAAAAELTDGQLEYFLRKFRDQRLDAFSAAPDVVAAAPTAESTPDEAAELRRLIDELNTVLEELHAMAPETPSKSAPNPYSPVALLSMMRDNLGKLAPDVQLDILRNFQGMTADDLKDIETWKGMAYMMTYSARFQAGQVRDKVSGTINQVVPEPVQPGRLWQLAKSGMDRVTPDIAKQILGTFQDATVDDLRDPDTWKGVWYMISYSMQFQAEQMRDRLLRAENDQTAA
jgi:transposase-like protein